MRLIRFEEDLFLFYFCAVNSLRGGFILKDDLLDKGCADGPRIGSSTGT